MSMYRLCLSLLLLSVVVSALSPATAPPEWLTSRLAEFGLQIHDFSDTGRGLQTTRSRAEGDVLVKVPEEDAVNVASMLRKFPVLAKATETSMESNGVQLTDEQILAVGLLLLKKEKDRYAISLPPQYSVLDMPDLLLTFLPVAYQKLIQAYRQHCSELRESVVENLPQDVSSLITEEDFRWAFATVRSRCVGMDGEDDARVRTGGKGEIRVMLPGFDLLNHKFGAVSSPGFNQEDKVYFVKSNDAYSNKDQVFISYSDQRDNLKMLMTYGFVAPGNPEQTVNFDVFNLFDALAAARPAYFSAPVLQQLWGLMQKLGKQRDLYEWDGHTKQPHESLISGIAMMADIEKQFLTEPDTDPSFESDVVAAMIVARRQELAQGIERIEQAEAGFNDQISCWLPMMSSIKLLLQEDERYLEEADCGWETIK